MKCQQAFLISAFGSILIPFLVFSQDITFERRIGIGNLEGQFTFPTGIAIDASSNVYVADKRDHRIQVFNSAGNFIREFGSYGSGVGEFFSPGGITVDNNGRIIIADTENSRVVIYDNLGNQTLAFGSAGFGEGQFTFPSDVATDANFNIYVADKNNSNISVFNASGAFQFRFGQSGVAAGSFKNPEGIAVRSNGEIFVADTNNDRIQVFNTNGTFLRSFGTTGSGNAQFIDPRGLRFGQNGNIYVADAGNNRIQILTADGIHVDNIVYTGTPEITQFFSPLALAIDDSDNVFVTDNIYRFLKFDEMGELVLITGEEGRGDGQLAAPNEVAVDADDNMYVVDQGNSRVQVFDKEGAFLYKFGAQAPLVEGAFSPRNIALDTDGNIFLTDSWNHQIQVFNNSGVYQYTFGTFGSSEGEFNNPAAVSIGNDGNVYILDRGNRRIQVFTKAGIFLRSFGSNGTGDGQFIAAIGIALDNEGNIYVVDEIRHDVQIFSNDGTFLRKFGSLAEGLGSASSIYVTPNGKYILVLEDTNTERLTLYDEDGVKLKVFGSRGFGENQFASPKAVTMNNSNEIIVADWNNNRVQVFSIEREDQSISTTSIADKKATDGSFDISATSTSGLPIEISVISGTDIASVNDNTITLSGVVGDVELELSQSGDLIYEPASSITLSFKVLEDNVDDDVVTGITNFESSTAYISPIPVNKILNVRIPADLTIQNAELIDMNLNLVYQRGVGQYGNELMIDASRYSNGLYILKLETNVGVSHHRVLIAH